MRGDMLEWRQTATQRQFGKIGGLTKAHLPTAGRNCEPYAFVLENEITAGFTRHLIIEATAKADRAFPRKQAQDKSNQPIAVETDDKFLVDVRGRRQRRELGRR